MSTEEQSGIWPPYQAFYLQSMLFNTGSVRQAAAGAQKCINGIDEGKYDPQQIKDVLLDFLQSIVSHSGAIARYFFPARNSPLKASPAQENLHKKRADYLKQIFKIDDSSPLTDKGLRNAIEHYDERLDLYLEQGIVGHIFPSLILDRPEETEVPHHIFRAYYLQEGIFQILDERYKIIPIIDEIGKIHELLIGFDKNGSMIKN